MKSLALLITEHQVVGQLLDALEVQVSRPEHDAEATAVTGELLIALGRFVEHVHMPKEEHVVFPYLERCGMTRSTAVVGALSAQHEAITAYGRRLRGMCERAAAGDPVVQPDLSLTLSAFLDLMREHMRIEEQYFYELADSMVEDGDQAGLSAKFRDIDHASDAPAAYALAEQALARAQSRP